MLTLPEKKFVVARDNIYAGIVVEPFQPELVFPDKDDKEIEEIKESMNETFSCYGKHIYRKIMFTLDENNLAIDLLFNSPRYAVVGMQPKKLVNKKIVVDDWFKLDELLTCLKYKEQLTASDIRKIYHRILNKENFIYKNCKLFGMKKDEQNFGGEASYSTSGEDSPLNTSLSDKLYGISISKTEPHPEEKKYVKITRRHL